MKYRVHCTVYGVWCTVYDVHRTQYTIHRTPYTTYNIPYTIHRTPYTVHRTPYTKHRTPYTAETYRTSYTIPLPLHLIIDHVISIRQLYTVDRTSCILHITTYAVQCTLTRPWCWCSYRLWGTSRLNTCPR